MQRYIFELLNAEARRHEPDHSSIYNLNDERNATQRCLTEEQKAGNQNIFLVALKYFSGVHNMIGIQYIFNGSHYSNFLR